MTIGDCYTLLNLTTGASQDDIKRAFRLKAKEFHPDHNNDPGANEAFIRLYEAYVILTGKNRPVANEIIPEREQRMKRARKAANYYARMKYEEYLRETEMYHSSPYAWIFRILYYGLFLLYLLCAMIFASVPLVLLTYHLKWFLFSCPLWVLSYFTFIYAYQWKKEIDPLFH